jgi:uncharacterized repeat protein (TIGR03803 family)
VRNMAEENSRPVKLRAVGRSDDQSCAPGKSRLTTIHRGRRAIAASTPTSWLLAAVLLAGVAAPAGAITVLKTFHGDVSDGQSMTFPLSKDGAGYLYGTTASGGGAGVGTVFKMKADGTGFTVLHSFALGPADGNTPYCGLALDDAGHLYGTTSDGGSAGQGTLFTLNTTGTGYAISPQLHRL